MIKARGVIRGLAVLAPAAVMLTAVQPAQASAPADFTKAVQKAVGKSLSGYNLREKDSRGTQSKLDSKQRVRVDMATFAARGRILIVARGVGADPEITAKQVPNGTVLSTLALRRPGAGVRQAVLSTTADQWGPGLTILAWTERRGVNYQLVAGGAIAQQDLVKLAKALPSDGSKATAKARTTIAKVKPPAASDVDAHIKQPQLPNTGVGLAGTPARGYVDGAGTVKDDLGNEGTLCNGCAYSNSNYTGMWQHILWADGKLGVGGIDCQFGPTTRDATKSWQGSHSLSKDGIVGTNTRSAAGKQLFEVGGSEVRYVSAATGRTVGFVRVSERYYFDTSTLPLVTYDRSGGRPPNC